MRYSPEKMVVSNAVIRPPSIGPDLLRMRHHQSQWTRERKKRYAPWAKTRSTMVLLPVSTLPGTLTSIPVRSHPAFSNRESERETEERVDRVSMDDCDLIVLRQGLGCVIDDAEGVDKNNTQDSTSTILHGECCSVIISVDISPFGFKSLDQSSCSALAGSPSIVSLSHL